MAFDNQKAVINVFQVSPIFSFRVFDCQVTGVAGFKEVQQVPD